MMMQPEYSQWFEAGVVITLACTAVVFAALAAERLVASAVWRRAIWQASAIGLVLGVLVEITGLARGLGQIVLGLGRASAVLTDEPVMDGVGPAVAPDREGRAAGASPVPAVGGVAGDAQLAAGGRSPQAGHARSPGPDAWLGELAEDAGGASTFRDGRLSWDADNFSEPLRVEPAPGTGQTRWARDNLAAAAPLDGSVVAWHGLLVSRAASPALDGSAHRLSIDRPGPTQAAGISDAGGTSVAENPGRLPAADSAVWPAVIWSVGGLMWGGYVLVGQVLLWVFRGRCPVVRDAGVLSRVGRLARRLRLSAPVRVVESPGLTTPVAFGTWQPTIVLPPGFTREFEPDEQEAMLAHELAHLATGDPAWQQVVNLLCGLLWWQPVVWVLRSRLRAASEAAADEASLLIPEGPRHLAACLVELGRRLTDAPRLGWIPMTGDGYRSNLGHRVRRLLALEPRIWRVPGTTGSALTKSVIVLLLVVAMVFGTAWARPRAALAQGESTMMQLRVTWSRSLAAAALAVLLGSFSGDSAADQPKLGAQELTGTQVALLAEEGKREGEARREGDRKEGEGEARRDGDRKEGEGEARRDGDRKEGEGEARREGDRKEGEGEARRDGDRKEGEGEARRDGDRKEGEGKREGDEPRREVKEGDREREGGREGEQRKNADQMRAEIEKLIQHARELKQVLQQLPDGADDKAREINGKLEVIQREIHELEGALRGTAPGPREGEGDRARTEERERAEGVFRNLNLMQEREKLMQRGRELNEALEKAKRERNEGAARELVAELEKLKARHQAMEQEMHAIRERFGDREQPRPDGPPPADLERGLQPLLEALLCVQPPGPPPADLERRLQHLRAAAENLRAAGMPDLAERLMSQAEQLARELGGRGGDRPREPQPDRPREGEPPRPPREMNPIGDLQRQLEEMRRQMEEMRNVLKELVERERSRAE